MEENRRREDIIHRVYAYEYEDNLCEIFSKIATINGFVYDLPFDAGLYSGEIINELARIRNISLSEAEHIFQYLIKYGVLTKKYGSDSYYPLCLRTKENKWNVVSDYDLNIHKWMLKHGYEDPRNLSDKDRMKLSR